jgi:hypothetical protein
MWSCCRRHARVSTCLRITNIAAGYSRTQFRSCSANAQDSQSRPHTLPNDTRADRAGCCAMVFSASTVVATERFGDANYFWLRQLMAGALGMAILFLIMKWTITSIRGLPLCSRRCRWSSASVSSFSSFRLHVIRTVDSASRPVVPAIGNGETRVGHFPGVLPGQAQGPH